MFEYYNNTLCVQARWLYEEAQVMTESNYKALASREKIRKLRVGGNGREALVAYESLPPRFKQEIEKITDPYESVRYVHFSDYIRQDMAAVEYYAAYLLENGEHIPEEIQKRYVHQAMVFNTVSHISTHVVTQRKFGGKKEMWENMLLAVQNLPGTWLHTRYSNLRSFKRALKRYQKEGYESLISGKFLNNNSTKITDEIGLWIMATYQLPVKYTVPEVIDIYDAIRESREWPELTERAVNAFLEKIENKRVWYIARHGREEYMKLFGHTVTRSKESLFPNSWWVIDGSKLDLVHYADNKRKMDARAKINFCFDVYSEKIIGFDVALKEDHASHFRTVKMAVNVAGCKPYTFTYDNQSGHKSARMQELYGRLIAQGGMHFPHKAYRKSSPAEQMIGRFQKQQIGKRWFSDKQSIKVRDVNNRPNTDFIIEYKEALPTLEELTKVVAVLVDRWNNSKKRKQIYTRNELYTQEAPKREEVTPEEQLALFWINETKPKKYTAAGMKMTVGGMDYEFEVYTASGEIDMEFRLKYVNERLIVRYDPEYLNDMIELYEETASGDKRFVAYATPKRQHKPIPLMMTEGERRILNKDIAVRHSEADRDWARAQQIAEQTGITREALISDPDFLIKMAGSLSKEEQESADYAGHLSKY